jgi:hypothetical protein
MDKNLEKKLVLEGSYEDVIEIDKHYFLVNKKDRICVLPYTLSTSNLLDKLGIVEDYNYVEEKKILTLLNDYVYDDDKTDLVAANRILFEIIGVNVISADEWMYLGTMYNNMSSDSLLKIYCVNISNIKIKTDEEVEQKTERKNFKLLDTATVVQSEDMLMLASYFRLFQSMYIKINNNLT